MSSSPTSSSSSDAAKLVPVPVPPPAPVTGPGPYDEMLDVVCPVYVVLGSARITVRDSLDLHPQQVMRLRESAGEDLQVLVNGVLVARGEVVVVDNSAAVRITHIAPAPGQDSQS
jgi:flagellar motor switch protein FliN